MVLPGPRGRAAVLALTLLAGSCGAGPGSLVRQYEYEEEMYLALDGSANVIVNASVPALVALRGLELNPDPAARLDRDALRAMFDGPGVEVRRVSRPWRRQGRRFVQVRLRVGDVRRLADSPAFAWATYELERRQDGYVYLQRVGEPAGEEVPAGTWNGTELVAFRMHLPSRIQYHNAPTKTVERGNILRWEQALADRLAGEPLVLEVRMETASILYTTLTIFVSAVGAALLAVGAVVWWVVRKGKAAES
jgi:hypothetical protein